VVEKVVHVSHETTMKIGYADYLYDPEKMEAQYGSSDYSADTMIIEPSLLWYLHSSDRKRLKEKNRSRNGPWSLPEVNAYYESFNG
jgi:hypothetical protein